MSETYNPSPAPTPPPVKRDLHGRPVVVKSRQGAATAWLPVVALFDYLRRRSD